MSTLSRFAVVLLLLAAAAAPAQQAPTIYFNDNFQTNTLKDYEVKGSVRWEKGAVNLGAGAAVRRKADLGSLFVIGVIVRFSGEPAAGRCSVILAEGERSARLELVGEKAQAQLGNGGAMPAQVMPLPPGKHRPWTVLIRVSYGLVESKAWPAGQPEPGAWQSARVLAGRGWQPSSVAVEAGAAAPVFLHGLNVVRRLPEPLSRQQVDQVKQAAALHAEGMALRRAGSVKAAVTKLREAQAALEKVLPPTHLDVATSLNNLGLALMDAGQLEEARTCYDRVLAVYRKQLPPLHPEQTMTMNNLGVLLRMQGKLDEARGYLERVVAIRRQILPPDDPSLAVGLTNLGALLRVQGKLAEAQRCYAEALAISRKVLPPDHLDLAIGLNNQGALLKVMGKVAEARGCYEESLAILRKRLPPGHPTLAGALNNLGMLLKAQGKLDEARRCYEEALAIRQKALPPDHPDLATSLNNLGMLLHAQGKLPAAERYYRQALAICRKALPPLNPVLATTLSHLGTVRAEGGNLAGAWPSLSEAAATWAACARHLAAGSSQSDHDVLIGQQRHYLDQLLSAAALADRLSTAQRRELLLRVLDSRAISAAALTGRRDLLLHGADDTARALALKLVPLRQRLANLLLHGRGKLSPEQYRQRCLDLQRQADDAERALALRVKAVAAVRNAEVAGPEELAARLAPGEALIQTIRYLPCHFLLKTGSKDWGPPHYAAVLLARAPDGAARVEFVTLGAAAPLEGAVRTWRKAVQQGRVDGGAERTLRRLLWEPLARALPPQTTRLVVAPDGELALVPLEALRLENGKYLVEEFAVRYVAGGRDLMPGPQPPPLPDGAKGLALILADPDYDLAGGKGEARAGGDLPPGVRFRSLPGFAREAGAVAGLLRGQAGWQVTLARRREATEERLAEVKRPRLLYGITHGFFLETVDRPPARPGLRDLELAPVGSQRPGLPRFRADPRLRSGLALAGANRWQERSANGASDGLLTALEVEQLDLWGTELVVLSACETGLGEVRIGEGVLGLRRAFQLAGAQTVVASLWKVPDVETEQLMTSFLARWLKGQGKADALRAAQLDTIRRLRAAARRSEAPPLYWAGFICHGKSD